MSFFIVIFAIFQFVLFAKLVLQLVYSQYCNKAKTSEIWKKKPKQNENKIKQKQKNR